MSCSKIMTDTEYKEYVKDKLEELPQLLRDHALDRLNDKGKNDLINLLIMKQIELEKTIAIEDFNLQ